MIKKFLLVIFTFFTLYLSSAGALSLESVTICTDEASYEYELISPSLNRPIDESTLYTTASELIIDLKIDVAHISIYDITGREIYHIKNCPSGQHTIDRSKLPSAPAIILVRLVDRDGNTKTFKVKLQ